MVLPRYIRLHLAVRLTLEMYEQHAFAADADAGFDGGEFSGPAHGRMVEHEARKIALRCRVTAYSVTDEINRASYDPGPEWSTPWQPLAYPFEPSWY